MAKKEADIHVAKMRAAEAMQKKGFDPTDPAYRGRVDFVVATGYTDDKGILIDGNQITFQMTVTKTITVTEKVEVTYDADSDNINVTHVA